MPPGENHAARAAARRKLLAVDLRVTVDRLVTELLLGTQQLVVLSHTIRTR